MLNKNLLDMLDETPDLMSRLLSDIVDEILTASVYKLKGMPLEGKIKEIEFGESRKSGNDVIEAKYDKNRGVLIEFNEDKTLVWSSSLPDKKIPLTGTSRDVAVKLFDNLKDTYTKAVKELSKFNAASIARKLFVSELRYGTQKQLIDEFYSVFENVKADTEAALIDNDHDREHVENIGLLARPEITDIIQYLKDNGEDTFNVKVINDNYKLD